MAVREDEAFTVVRAVLPDDAGPPESRETQAAAPAAAVITNTTDNASAKAMGTARVSRDR